MSEYDEVILQSRSDDTAFTSRFIVDSPAVETAKWHGALLALVVSPIPTDGTKRQLGLLRGCGGGGKVSWYRGRETGDSLTHGNYQALQGIGRRSTHRFLDKRGKVFPVENGCANVHVRLLPLRARSRELPFIRNGLACAPLGGFPGLIVFVYTKIRARWLCIVRALFARRVSMR
jgi:hypothetical protein